MATLLAAVAWLVIGAAVCGLVVTVLAAFAERRL